MVPMPWDVIFDPKLTNRFTTDLPGQTDSNPLVSVFSALQD
jgi:hypothetical protein